jgi:hypothetical protein
MKILKLIAAGIILQCLFTGAFLLSTKSANSQAVVAVNVGTPPPWGPVGYSNTRYYYIPDVESYYDVHTSRFIYMQPAGTWVHRKSLPAQYRNYDLYNGYKVVMIDYNGNAPYSNFKEYRVKYAKGYKGGAQQTIGRRPGRGNSGIKGNAPAKAAPVRNKKAAPAIHKGESQGNDKNKSGEQGQNHGNGKKK